MIVLVTGGAGFIGGHVVEALVKLEHQVTVLDNFSTGKKENLVPGCQVVVGDIRDRDVVDRCVRGQDVVFHLAAFTSVPHSLERPEECFDTNVNGTRNLLESACRAGVSRIIFASSSAIYPELPDCAKAEALPPEPKSPYASSKLEGEALLRWFHRHKRLNYVGFRYFNVYGPRQDTESEYAAVIPIFITKSLRHGTLTIYGDGRQTRDFVYIEDVVRADLQAMNSEVCGIFNVGTGQAVSVLGLAQTIIHLVGSSSGYSFAPARPGDILSCAADTALIGERLGWRSHYSLAEGLEETIKWYREKRD